MYAELTEGQRKQGGTSESEERGRFEMLKAADIDIDLLDKKASDWATLRKFIMLLRLLNGSERRNILKGGEKYILPFSTAICHHHNRWAANDDDDDDDFIF